MTERQGYHTGSNTNFCDVVGEDEKGWKRDELLPVV